MVSHVSFPVVQGSASDSNPHESTDEVHDGIRQLSESGIVLDDPSSWEILGQIVTSYA